MIETPLWNHLAPMYQYYDGGWAFEDGACPWGHPQNEEEWCDCPRPWSDAWMALGDALRATDPAWDPGTRALIQLMEYPLEVG